jgi:hypothetical protein
MSRVAQESAKFQQLKSPTCADVSRMQKLPFKCEGGLIMATDTTDPWTTREMFELAENGVRKVDQLGQEGIESVTTDEIAAMAAVIALSRVLKTHDLLIEREGG